MNILGVDPGFGGAFVVLRDGDVTDVADMPVMKIGTKNRVSPVFLRELIRDLSPLDVAYVEDVGPMPTDSRPAAFSFGQAHGIVLGALGMAGVRTELIRPPTWRKVIKFRGDKDAARARAMELSPDRVGAFKRKKDEGRAEALLIAHAGAQLEGTDNGSHD